MKAFLFPYSMRHASPATTQGYMNMAKMLNRTAEKLDVPNVASATGG